MFNTNVCLNKAEICITHVQINFANVMTNKKRFIVLNTDEILAKQVKNFSCIFDKSSRSYQVLGVVRNTWVEVAKKIEFLEDGKCC